MPHKQTILLEIDNLKRDKNLIIVEGEHDSDALEELGLEHIFILNKAGVSLFNRIEEIISLLDSKDECVILTDFDKKGREYYSVIRHKLINNGLRINNRLRDLLFRAKVSHIEGLATFLRS